MTYSLQRADVNSGNAIVLTSPTSETVKKSSPISVYTIPGENSTETNLVDFFGTTTDITLMGKYTGTLANAKTFISNLRAFLTGKQSDDGTTTYVSSTLLSSLTVCVESFEYTWEAGQGESGIIVIDYTIKMIEGKVLIS